MATLEEYEAVAPEIMAIGEFTVLQIETKLEAIPEPPEPPGQPTVTKAKIVSIFNTIFNTYSPAKAIEKAGGIKAVANANNLTTAQAVSILSELSAMKALYDSEEEE